LKLIISNTIDSEIKRFIFTINTIYHTPSLLDYYLVLRKPHKKYDCFVLPDLDILQNINFQADMREREFNLPLEGEIVNKWVSILKKEHCEYFSKLIVELEENNKINSKIREFLLLFLEDLAKVIDMKNLEIKQVEIFRTKIGSGGSYYIKEGKLFIYLRADRDMSSLANIVLLSFIRNIYFKTNNMSQEDFIKFGGWEKIKIISDFLMTSTELKKYFSNYVNFLKFKSLEIPAKLKNKSTKYLEKIGFNYEKLIKIIDNKIFINKQIETHLNKNQRKLLKYFISKEGEICSFDEIYEFLWGKNFAQKYSIYYLPKLVFELRTFLNIHIPSKKFIYTKRGEGYLFVQ